MSQHSHVLVANSNKKNIILITISDFFIRWDLVHVTFQIFTITHKNGCKLKSKHKCLGDQISIGFLTPLAIHVYVSFIEIKLFKKYSSLTLKSMEIDKRSNHEHHVTEAATLAMTTV